VQNQVLDIVSQLYRVINVLAKTVLNVGFYMTGQRICVNYKITGVVGVRYRLHDNGFE